MKSEIKNKINKRFISIIVICWIIDFITKIWAVDALKGAEGISIIGEYLRFHYVLNTGGIFGIGQGNPMPFQILTGIAIVFLLTYYLRSEESGTLFEISIALVAGGAFGNFTDRFFREGVVDFIDMGIGSSRWPTYNPADAFISIGAVLLAIAFYQIEKELKQKEKNAAKVK
ncbi:MAG: signal peptidase II [Spirochaetia bacterium]|nr:signal peptidase II [Spirochaetia bacterium]